MSPRSPLPVRNGVNATRLRVPLHGTWPTIFEYVLERFGHVDPAGIRERFTDGEIVDTDGRPLSLATPLGDSEYIWYYRSIPHEKPLPVTETVLYQDDHIVVADKPHFLPTTPAGKFVQESLLVRLRNRLDLPDLTPVHRLDRGTAGLVLLVKDHQLRGRYQQMFHNREVSKTYRCVSALQPSAASGAAESIGELTAERTAARFPLTVINRIEKIKGVVVSKQVSYGTEHSGQRPHQRGAPTGKRSTEVIPGPNAASRIELLGTGSDVTGTLVGHFQLTPHTGKTHQLRMHMAMLGLGIINDRFYPDLLPDAPDQFDAPLQLLAAELSFRDPLTHKQQSFRTQRVLSHIPQPSDE